MQCLFAREYHLVIVPRGRILGNEDDADGDVEEGA